jgi:uncharacterized lipoprotein YajG
MIARNETLSACCFLLALLMLSGCASQAVKFVQPQSGATAECSASGFGIGAGVSDSYLTSCVRSYEGRGFVKLDQLTPAQRADLEARGLMPKE